ncbi:restriction endonuclease subunit R [Oculatella sp. FACHB-28]|uniref:restriction endonuclease subunit R n=1 Tax=Cyanophyceae TaxID=3028117 RepID=UPI0016863D0B|nr:MULTISPECIES: restriction endonuclease subunit R [Cyanophyceae]MBD1868761.1 restriction endonuclease subunit R [Cyanobacteria bacterium FACHB-471]MBD2057013.1 restriction endonuclease subunit R [Oculatella sp. FACHB-28]MBD2067929.1 restriction endonuclease subunit R [Leptolyngbya sp. FACHB-671]
MVQTLQARTIDLRHLIDHFKLELAQDEQFFREWQVGLPEITDVERQFLDKVKAGYLNLLNYPPVLEKAVQISVLGPLLFLADFYLPPFHIKAEKSVEIQAEDEGVIVRGQIDILLLKEQFWLMAIESKEFSFSTDAGLAQLLAYMLANPNPDKPGFGLIATGSTFTFVKLVQGEVPQYATSDQFGILNRTNGLYDVFRILKRISQL